mmetsp:Transcript_9308/g.34860  ORF Transcript_9308/g.34860 Transcript_9308/m.34860 type:complete len:216 (-) Transcript_9308:41-688(-)
MKMVDIFQHLHRLRYARTNASFLVAPATPKPSSSSTFFSFTSSSSTFFSSYIRIRNVHDHTRKERPLRRAFHAFSRRFSDSSGTATATASAAATAGTRSAPRPRRPRTAPAPALSSARAPPAFLPATLSARTLPLLAPALPRLIIAQLPQAPPRRRRLLLRAVAQCPPRSHRDKRRRRLRLHRHASFRSARVRHVNLFSHASAFFSATSTCPTHG